MPVIDDELSVRKSGTWYLAPTPASINDYQDVDIEGAAIAEKTFSWQSVVTLRIGPINGWPQEGSGRVYATKEEALEVTQQPSLGISIPSSL